MSQIITITSEALQATIRRLLPSQQGFGEDLQASNVIVPMIDVTPTAEGTQLPSFLQRATSVTDLTTFGINNSTSVIVNTPGFWEVSAAINMLCDNASDTQVKFSVSDGLTTKDVARWEKLTAASLDILNNFYWTDIIYLRAGDSLSGTATAFGSIYGSYRQIADVNGNLVNPAGFTFE